MCNKNTKTKCYQYFITWSLHIWVLFNVNIYENTKMYEINKDYISNNFV